MIYIKKRIGIAIGNVIRQTETFFSDPKGKIVKTPINDRLDKFTPTLTDMYIIKDVSKVRRGSVFGNQKTKRSFWQQLKMLFRI